VIAAQVGEPVVAPRRLAAMPHLIRYVALLLAVSVSACSSTTVLPGTGPLVTATMHGGECVGGVTCDTTIYLDRDGRAHSAAKPPNDLGHVPADAMATLTAAIAQTDFATIRSHKFTGQCPTAVDGQELIFEFAAGTGTERISSCEVAIDWHSPLFLALRAALGQWVGFPPA
jgi:hypothetical protein